MPTILVGLCVACENIQRYVLESTYKRKSDGKKRMSWPEVVLPGGIIEELPLSNPSIHDSQASFEMANHHLEKHESSPERFIFK